MSKYRIWQKPNGSWGVQRQGDLLGAEVDLDVGLNYVTKQEAQAILDRIVNPPVGEWVEKK